MMSSLPETRHKGTYSVKRLVGDHDGGGVRTHVSRQAFDLAGQVQQLADFTVVFIGVAQVFTLLQRAFERDVQFLGHHVRDFVDTRQRDPECSPHILDRGPGGERTEGADLSDVVFAVLVLDVPHHVGTSFLAESRYRYPVLPVGFHPGTVRTAGRT